MLRNDKMKKSLFIFGIGGSALALITHLRAQDASWNIAGTVRSEEKAASLREQNIEAYAYDFSEGAPLPQSIKAIVQNASHIFITIPPNEAGCPVAQWMENTLKNENNFEYLQWLGYCSSTGVYGDAYGKWVDETTPPAPVSASGKRRLLAENQWQDLLNVHSIPSHIFRIAGIYGMGRNALLRVQRGVEQMVYAPDHFISRIHEEDIAQGVAASMAQPCAGEVYNLADDAPAPSHVPLEYAAELLKVAPPPRVPIAQAELSDFAKGMYRANKRVSSAKIHETLGVSWYYPSYKDGLAACLRHLSRGDA